MSRLEQMRSGFQDRLIKEKESKLLQIQADNDRRAEERIERMNQGSGISKQGSVRNFFVERRALEQTNSENIPSRDVHYKINKKESVSANYKILTPSPKNSAGRDRAKPLAPINRSAHSRQTAKPPAGKRTTNLRKPENHRTSDHSGSDYYTDDSLPPAKSRSAPKVLKQRSLAGRAAVRAHTNSSDEEALSSTYKVPTKKKEKLTDFQKWKLEQDEASQRRKEAWLEKQRQEKLQQGDYDDENNDEEPDSDNDNDNDNDDDDDDIEQKQLAIQALIRKKQQELLRMQKDKEEEEKIEAILREQERIKESQREKTKLRQQKEQKEMMQREQEEEELRQNSERNQRIEHNTRTKQSTQSTEIGYKQSVRKESKPKPKMVKHRPLPPPQDNNEGPPIEHSDASFYSNMISTMAEATQEGDVYLVPCDICGRKFAEERLNKHRDACAKSNAKKRKVFDPVKMRNEGTEAEKYVRDAKLDKTPQPKKSNWREKRQGFIDSLRYAKKCAEIEAQGGKVSDLPPPPKMDNSDLVPCPTCNRKFNCTAAERHIPWCKEQAMKKKMKPGPPKKR